MRLSPNAAAVVLLSAAYLTGCGGSEPGTARTERLSIATGGTGGVFYPYGGGIAKIISENLDHVEATAEVTAASVDNLKFIHQGASDLGFTMADAAQDAALGRESFAPVGRIPLRSLANLYESYVHLGTLESSGIRRVQDLRGRTVSIGSPGSGTAILATRILQAAGLDPARDIRAQGLGVAQSVDALKDGKIDAFFWNGGLPTAAVLDLVNTPGIRARLLPTVDVLPELQRRFGESLYFESTIPKDVYGQPADIPVVAVANLLVTSDRLQEQLAYDITRLLFEKQGDLAAIHPEAKNLALDRAVTGSPIPFHPGAIRYYRERGTWKE